METSIKWWAINTAYRWIIITVCSTYVSKLTRSLYAIAVVTTDISRRTVRRIKYQQDSSCKFSSWTQRTAWPTSAWFASAVTRRATMPMLVPRKLFALRTTHWVRRNQLWAENSAYLIKLAVSCMTRKAMELIKLPLMQHRWQRKMQAWMVLIKMDIHRTSPRSKALVV